MIVGDLLLTIWNQTIQEEVKQYFYYFSECILQLIIFLLFVIIFYEEHKSRCVILFRHFIKVIFSQYIQKFYSNVSSNGINWHRKPISKFLKHFIHISHPLSFLVQQTCWFEFERWWHNTRFVTVAVLLTHLSSNLRS